jgi:hypothetical protein
MLSIQRARDILHRRIFVCREDFLWSRPRVTYESAEISAFFGTFGGSAALGEYNEQAATVRPPARKNNRRFC